MTMGKAPLLYEGDRLSREKRGETRYLLESILGIGPGTSATRKVNQPERVQRARTINAPHAK